MKSFSPPYFEQLAFTAADLATIQRLGEARGRQALFFRQVPEQLEVLRQTAIIESSESSSRIEGVLAAPERIAALVKQSSEPRNRSEQEIAGYRDALALIHDSHAYMPFAINVVLQLHTMLFRYVAGDGGRWKPADNDIIERDAVGNLLRVRFRAVSAVQTPQAMADLVEGYRQATVQDLREPLVAVPLAILDFLCVHPFRDGNGRVARLLTLLLLYHFDYQVGRFISLERIIEESKETHYEALERSSQGWHQGEHPALPWLRYFWGVMIRAYDEFEERVGAMVAGRGSKGHQVREAVQRRIGPFSLGDIEAACPGVSRDMVRVVLRELRDSGAIELQGKGRGARWLKKG